ncbi:ABC transporter ATP-binding protein [Micromonospora sp. NPDC005087]|uniref:ABC transporter ATP-binding protein n=1 Tax=Micromonospora sp. NPDC005087 TaxID=3364225 RepID=UPI0036842508
MTDQLLSVRNVSAGYGDVTALWGVSLELAAGELLGVVGANGAGKTTLLSTIVGLNPVFRGTITFAGRDLGRVPPHARVQQGLALVQEGKRIFRRLTVEDNLLLGGYSVTRRRGKLTPLLDAVYARFPALADRRHQLAGALSGGQQQMLAIGQAVLPRPRLLMLDEPSAGLAPSIVADVLAAVNALRADGMTVVLVEQAVESVMAIADRLVVLDLGRVVLDRAVREIDDVSVVRQAYFGAGSTITAARP